MKAPLLATIDIGSNSILLLVGRIVQGRLQIELQRKETIRLGGALNAVGQLHPQAIERGLDCLRRYAELIEHIPTAHRRAVATQTLREAHNRDFFLQQANEILDCQVELISGQQEASLIYQGVSSMLPSLGETRLVVDIGGRSTEICLGMNERLLRAASCPLGSVAWAQRFFASGTLDSSTFGQAEAAARTILNSYLTDLGTQHREQVYGASGTAGAISKVLYQAGHDAGTITHAGLQQLKHQLVQAGHIDRLPLQGLRDELKPVIGGGVSIMCAVFDVLHIERMRIAQGALRHGLLFQRHHELQTSSYA